MPKDFPGTVCTVTEHIQRQLLVVSWTLEGSSSQSVKVRIKGYSSWTKLSFFEESFFAKMSSFSEKRTSLVGSCGEQCSMRGSRTIK